MFLFLSGVLFLIFRQRPQSDDFGRPMSLGKLAGGRGFDLFDEERLLKEQARRDAKVAPPCSPAGSSGLLLDHRCVSGARGAQGTCDFSVANGRTVQRGRCSATGGRDAGGHRAAAGVGERDRP